MIQKGTPILISSQDLLDYVSQEEIASRYILGFNKIGESFKSEFRQEADPSSRLFWSKYNPNLLYFKDFGDPLLNKALSMVEYVQYKYNLNYQEAINKIAKDFRLVGGKDSSFSIVRRTKNKVKRGNYTPSDLIIKVKKREFSVYDEDYWGQYYIPIKMLKRNNIWACSHVFYNNYPPVEYAASHLIYSYNYYWSRNIFRRKIYQPISKIEKWRSNIDESIVQNYPNIPKSGNTLFIQSSYKDCMSMELLGYYAIAPNKEGSWFPLPYWDKLKKRWKNIILIWNNDHYKPQNSGLLMAQNFSKMYDIPYIMTPAVDKITDISEFNRDYGLRSGRDLIQNLIKNI